MSVPKVVFYLSFDEESARLIHRLLRDESRKKDAPDSVLRSWFRLDAAMKRRGIAP